MTILYAIHVVALVVAMFGFVMTLYHFWHTVKGIKGSKETIANLMGPFAFFFASNFDEKGNYHRARLSRYMLLTVACIAVVLVLSRLLGIGSQGEGAL